MSLEFKEKGIDAWVSLNIHDQAVITVKEGQEKEACEIVQRCMEKTNTLAMPLIAVPQIAYNLRDGH